MPTTRRRRIARIAVMVMAVVVLVPAGYVGSAFSLVVADCAGWFPSWFRDVLVLVYAPLNWYINSGHPGADELSSLAGMAGQAGDRIAGR